MSKIIQIGFAFLLVGILSLPKAILCQKGEKKSVPVYSHGFGKTAFGGSRGPNYPDARGQIFKAVFYTKPAVHTLANYLKDKVDAGYNAIDLAGRSCGAGTAINCLEKLVYYDENPGYFDGTEIKSKKDAEVVVSAVNNGSLDLTVPLLSLKKTNAVAIPSKYLGYTGIAYACYKAHNYGLFDTVLEMAGINPTIIRTVGAAATTTVAATYVLGSTAKNLCATIIDAVIIPPITTFHYNPLHTKPIDAVERLKGHITCPTLIHCCKEDGVIENPDEDTVKLYNALRTGNENQTHIYLSEPGDGCHNERPQGYTIVKKEFYSQYKIGKGYQELDKKLLLEKTQPTLEELRKQIYRPTTE